MDRVVQILSNLARYTDALAEALGDDIEVDTSGAFEALQLGELTSVLRTGRPAPKSFPSGNVDLF